MSAPYDLKNIPASALPGFPFEDATQQLIKATQCTAEEAELALADCIIHPRPLVQVAKDRFADVWLGQHGWEPIAEFLKLDDYARYVSGQGALIEVHYRGTAWTCEIDQVGKRELYGT